MVNMSVSCHLRHLRWGGRSREARTGLVRAPGRKKPQRGFSSSRPQDGRLRRGRRAVFVSMVLVWFPRTRPRRLVAQHTVVNGECALYGCNRTGHALFDAGIEPAEPGPSGSPRCRFSPRRGLCSLRSVDYQLPHTNSVFQFSSWSFVSSSRNSLESWSTCFWSCATERVATNLTSDLE